jgi:hypothetical protein
MEKQFIEDHLDDFCNVYLVGSRLYDTNRVDSDYDYICVFEDNIFYQSPSTNIHLFTKEMFQLKIDNHYINVLECLFTIPIKQESIFKFQLNRQKLRQSISTITSNSWVKGKKKLIVLADYDLMIGIKSVFHSLRILDYGIQIAAYGKILEYSSINYVLYDLFELSKSYEHDELWNKIDEKYRKTFNSLSTQFKVLCPKYTDTISEQLEQLLRENDCFPTKFTEKNMINKIICFFNERK